MAGLSLKHVYKVYPNGAKAVNDFNMQIADKEFIVFVGPSGCGKSTTLRMIAGLEDITAGELKIGDLVVNDVEPKDRDIAMVFQNYALYPHMTVYENIAFGLRLRKLPKEEVHRRVLEAAEILGITEYLGRKPKEMSGGQRQRVSLGRAIVREPKVMLLDEPLSNLDAKLRTQMRAEIAKLHAKLQTTFIYVTHDQVEAMTMGTRIVVMRGGFVQQIDTPKNLYDYPCNKFVASFIGTPQMNFFEATLLKKGEEVQVRFEYCDAEISVPYPLLYKVRPSYLNGEKRVFVGLRAEDIRLGQKRTDFAQAVVPVKISHKEELGNETLVYGDLNMGGDGYLESSTRVCVKMAGDITYSAGEVVDALLDFSRVHLFDGESEQTVMPRIPAYNFIDCTVKKGVLCFLGESVALPPAIACTDGAAELLVPCDAFRVGGSILATVEGVEAIDGRYLLSLSLGGRRLFMTAESAPRGKQIKLSLDMKRIELLREGERLVAPMPLTVKLYGKFVKQKRIVAERIGKRTKRRKKVEFVLEIAGAKFPAPEEVAQKLFSTLGVRGALSKRLRFECSPYELRVAEEGISAEVLSVFDYGEEQFAFCKVEGGEAYVKVEKPCAGKLYLMPDVERLAVVDEQLELRMI